MDSWVARDPIARYEKWLRSRGEADSFFSDIRAEADDFAADIRRRTLALEPPESSRIFDHVYSDAHPVVAEQKSWLAEYDAAFETSEITAIGGEA